MPAEYVVALNRKLESLRLPIWIDGGWAVDALLERQTRAHADLDIALEYRFVEALRRYLASIGYENVERDDTTQWNFVMGDDKGHEIDFHAFVFDESGSIVDGLTYPKGSLTGSGSIIGHPVRCIDPVHLIAFHSGYQLQEKDYADVSLLCERFGIALPREYERAKPK